MSELLRDPEQGVEAGSPGPALGGCLVRAVGGVHGGAAAGELDQTGPGGGGQLLGQRRQVQVVPALEIKLT